MLFNYWVLLSQREINAIAIWSYSDIAFRKSRVLDMVCVIPSVFFLWCSHCKSCSEPCGGKGDSDMLQRWLWLWHCRPWPFLILRLTLRSEICLMELEVLGNTMDHVMRQSSRYYLLCCYCCCLLIMLLFNVVSYEELCPPLWLSSMRDVTQGDSGDFTVLSPRGVIGWLTTVIMKSGKSKSGSHKSHTFPMFFLQVCFYSTYQ